MKVFLLMIIISLSANAKINVDLSFVFKKGIDADSMLIKREFHEKLLLFEEEITTVKLHGNYYLEIEGKPVKGEGNVDKILLKAKVMRQEGLQMKVIGEPQMITFSGDSVETILKGPQGEVLNLTLYSKKIRE